MKLYPKPFTLYPLLFTFLMFISTASAQELQSGSFKVLDPILDSGGEYMTSGSFRLLGSVSQIAIGTSSTGASFSAASGFLYYPEATTPVASATAGDGQVSLSWTVSAGHLGWVVSNYNVGRAAISGGPYVYSSVGSTTSATVSGLANGTAYYFVVRPEDFYGSSLATSTEVSATPVAAAPTPAPTPPPSFGGGPILEFLKEFLKPKPPIVVVPPEKCPYPQPDLNCDGKIDIQDLSIFLFLTEKPTPNQADFNEDDEVNLRDLSALFFHWTERLLAFGPDERVIAGLPEEKPRQPGFLERLFGRKETEPAAVTPAVEENGMADAPAKGIISGIADFFIWLFVAVMEFIIKAIVWVLGLFR